jgi:hypothetical protein
MRNIHAMLLHFAALMTERDIAARLSTIILVPHNNIRPKRFVSVHRRTIEQTGNFSAAAVDAAHNSDTNGRKIAAATCNN